MTPSARVQAAIEILDAVIASARDGGPPADAIVSGYFKTRRYAGSKDRRAVRELVFAAIRQIAERPASGRSAMLALAEKDPELYPLFDGSPHGPSAIAEGEDVAERGLVPAWLEAELSPLVTADEYPALLERAPLDLRVNVARIGRENALTMFEGATATPLSPWGIRVPSETRVDQHPAYLAGEIEVQDEGSQLIALACQPRENLCILDLCAGAGGKALALAAVAPDAIIVATDTNRARLSKLPSRAERAGAAIEARLLDGGRETPQLAAYEKSFDVVLVDAPCSGSGTWRRNPEGRWRLTPEQLHRVTDVQSKLLEVAARLVRPGGSLVYAVCSILAREGAGQVDDFLGRHSSWIAQDTLATIGRSDGRGRLLTPACDSTDGFFVATMTAP